MLRYAVFVDAGYLYAQGSKVLANQRLPREDVDLNLSVILRKLRQVARNRATGASLLRFYWYDGLVRGRLSTEQEALAFTENVKLRLGVVTPAGRQKGVDSLIVTDLLELARNRAISDAVLLSGDEDLRIGVQMAQSFGVRIHLVGIEPSRGSQSHTLLQESDTTTEWKRNNVSEFLSLRPGYVSQEALALESGETSNSQDSDAIIISLAMEFVATLGPRQLQQIAALAPQATVPREVDGRLLATCRTGLGRNLTPSEASAMRQGLRDAVRIRLEGS